MSKQCCWIRIFNLFLCLVANVVINAQYITPQSQFDSQVTSTGFSNSINRRFGNAGPILRTNIQTSKDQNQWLDDGLKNEPSQPVISFVIPSYASGITHLLKLDGESPKVLVPSEELMPPIGSKLPSNDIEIDSRALLTTESQHSPDFISKTILPSLPIAINKNYEITIATPVSDKMNIESTASPVSIRPIEGQIVSNFKSLCQTVTLAKTSTTAETTTSSIPGILFGKNSSELQDETTNISHQNSPTTNHFQELITPEYLKRLLILGEQKTPGFAIRSDGSVDSSIGFSHTTVKPNINFSSFGFEKMPIRTSIPILLPAGKTSTIVPESAFRNENLTNVSNSNQTTTPYTMNHLSLSTEKSKIDSLPSTKNPFTAFEASGLKTKSTSSPLVQNRLMHASLFSQTTNYDAILTTTEITTLTSDSVPTKNSSLIILMTNFALNASVPQPPSVENGVTIPENIPVPDNNPFLPPLAPITGIPIANSTLTHNSNNLQNIQTTNLYFPENSATYTENSINDNYSATFKPFTSFNFRSPTNFKNNQTFDNSATIEETSHPILVEQSKITPTPKTLSTFFELVPDSIAVVAPSNDLLPPIFLNEDLLPPLSPGSWMNIVKNETENNLHQLSSNNNPFLPKLDLNPFLAPFSSNPAQTNPQ